MLLDGFDYILEKIPYFAQSVAYARCEEEERKGDGGMAGNDPGLSLSSSESSDRKGNDGSGTFKSSGTGGAKRRMRVKVSEISRLNSATFSRVRGLFAPGEVSSKSSGSSTSPKYTRRRPAQSSAVR